MKRAAILLLAVLLAVSCVGRSERVKVDIDKALKRQVDVRKLFTEATVIPLYCPEGKTFGQEEKVVLEVAADRIFLAFDQDGKEYVLVYNLGNGKYYVVDYEAFPLGVIYDGSNYYCRPEGEGWVIVRYTL